jgi:hypothetical protein
MLLLIIHFVFHGCRSDLQLLFNIPTKGTFNILTKGTLFTVGVLMLRYIFFTPNTSRERAS